MRRVAVGAVMLVVLSVVVGSAVASDLDGLWMSLTPGGPAQTDFPAGTDTVYVVFEYTDFVSENVRIVVSDYKGSLVFDETRTFSGRGVASVPVTLEEGPFPDGLYVTTLYFAGQYFTRAVEWTVGGVDSPPPVALPPARLEVEPAVLTFNAIQGGSNPPAQHVLVSNNTAAASTWRATADVPWIDWGALSDETPSLLRIRVDIAGLPAGTYAGRVVVSADDIKGSPQTVGITLAISPPDGTTTLELPAVAEGGSMPTAATPTQTPSGIRPR